MASGILGKILFQIELFTGLSERDSIVVLKFIGAFRKNLRNEIWTKP